MLLGTIDMVFNSPSAGDLAVVLGVLIRVWSILVMIIAKSDHLAGAKRQALRSEPPTSPQLSPRRRGEEILHMIPVLRYVALAFGISWLAVLPLMLEGLGLVSFHLPALWHLFGAIGPVGAAYMLRRHAEPRIRVRDLYRRQGERGVSPRWGAFFILSPVALLALAWVGMQLGGLTLDTAALARAVADPGWLAMLAVASVGYGLGEEPGWRGWLLPRLQQRSSPVLATLILAVIWASWHLPFFAYRFDFDGAGTVVGFFVGILAGAYWLTFLFNTTGGSVWTVALWHLVWNIANLVAAELSITLVAVLNTLMIVLGFGVALVWGRRGLQMQ